MTCNKEEVREIQQLRIRHEEVEWEFKRQVKINIANGLHS